MAHILPQGLPNEVCASGDLFNNHKNKKRGSTSRRYLNLGNLELVHGPWEQDYDLSLT